MPWRSIDPDALLNFVRETSAAAWMVDSDGYALDVPEWTALTGQTAEQAEGDGWMDAIHPEDVDRVRSAWTTSVAHGTPYNTDYRLCCADGSYRWFNARGTAVRGPDGQTQKWVGVILAIPGSPRLSPTAGNDRPRLADKFQDISPGALRAARAILGWSAEKLANEAGVVRSTVRRLESDDQADVPRRSTLPKILRVLAAHKLKCIGSGNTIVAVVDPKFAKEVS